MRYLFIFTFFFIGCAPAGRNAYQVPSGVDTAALFLYTPDTYKKFDSAVLIYIDKIKMGELAENTPLQLSVATGWHTLVVNRKSALGAREALASLNLLVEKNEIYYVRFGGIATPDLQVVNESDGRQMR